MHNFGYSKSTTADETVIVDCYCFVIAICSHHLVMSLALTPVVVLGWDSAGSVGQFLFYSGAVGDLAYSIYDSVQVTLRTFFPVSFKCLGVQLPKKYFIVMVCLHHMLDVVTARCRWHLLPAELLQIQPGHTELSSGLLAV